MSGNFTIRSSQRDYSWSGWLKVHFDDRYKDTSWIDRALMNMWGIVSLVRNADRICYDALGDKARFAEAYDFCERNKVRKVRNQYIDVEPVVAVYRGFRNLSTEHDRMSCDMWGLSLEVEDLSKTRKFGKIIDGGRLYIYETEAKRRIARFWIDDEYRMEQASATMIELAMLFNFSFDCKEINGSHVFTVSEGGLQC